MSFQFAGLGAGMVTEVALIRFLACVAASMHDKITLELEGFSTEFAGLGLHGRGGLLGQWCWSGLGTRGGLHGWKGGCGEERWFGSCLEWLQKPLHGAGPVG